MDSHPQPQQQPPPPRYPSHLPPHHHTHLPPQYALTPPPLPLSVPTTHMHSAFAHPPHHSTLLHPPPHPIHPDDPHPSSAPLPPPPAQHPHHLPSLHPASPPRHHYYDHPYSASAKIARLESELEKARLEIDRLRIKLAEFEKERAKTESPKVQSRYWTPAEHKRFLEALQKFGPKDVRAIANYVGSRNATQVRTHAQKYFLRVAREAKQGAATGGGAGLQTSRKRSMSESDLARVGRSVRTPPGSPHKPVFGGGDATMTEGGMGNLPPAATAAGEGVSGLKPPVGGKGAGDNAGMNLLSMVASERKMEAERLGER